MTPLPEMFTAANLLYVLAIAVASFFVVAGIRQLFKTLAHRFGIDALKSKTLNRVIGYIIFVAAALVILNRFGFGTNNLLAILGTIFGLVAIGFVAVWSVLSNFLCTLIILSMKPFVPGDRLFLPSENIGGEVFEIGLTFTVLKTEKGTYLHVPNNMFFQKIFVKETVN